MPDVQELVMVFQVCAGSCNRTDSGIGIHPSPPPPQKGPSMEPVAALHDNDLVPVPLLDKYMPNAKVYAPFLDVYTQLVRAMTKGRPFIELVASMTGRLMIKQC